MEIKRLDWDSNFLGREVFGVTLKDVTDPEEIVRSLLLLGAELAYFFLQDAATPLSVELEKIGAVLYDDKLTYGKQLTIAAEDNSAIETYEGELTNELLQLAFLAGHESRFKKDPRLEEHFEPLYKLWMVNSLSGQIADRVFVYREGDTIGGMVTCKIRPDGSGSIGLIATDPRFQGKGVGTRLVKATEKYYHENNVPVSTVVTQRTNTQACRFYETAGFTIYRSELVYHLWFNQTIL